MALLASVPSNLGNRYALNPDLNQSVLDFVQFEGLDDCFNLLHSISVLSEEPYSIATGRPRKRILRGLQTVLRTSRSQDA
jgi:hypothetical protein